MSWLRRAARSFDPSERERILRAAAGLCAERGIEEFELADLVARSGVEEADLVELFDDKEGAAAAAISWYLGEMMGALSGAYSADRSEVESALAGVQAILELLGANPSFTYLGHITARNAESEPLKVVYETAGRLLSVMIERLGAYSDASGQPPRAARAAIGGGEALVRRELAQGRGERLPALLPDMIYTAAVPFLGQEEALRLAQQGRDLLAGTRWAQ